MKKIIIMVVLLLLASPVYALTAGEAKQEWRDAKKESLAAQTEHRDAKIAFAGNKSEDNRQEVVDTGKEVLHAALDEVEAWLVWKNLEAEESEITDDLKETIADDIETNLEKIEVLRTDVDGVTNQFELGIVFLKMVGKYVELLTDVARDAGMIWVQLGEDYLDRAEDYESKLRAEAENMDDNSEILEKLDNAKDDLEEARANVDKAEDSYEQVVLPGTPLIKFAEGNNYLRVARTNLLSAHAGLNQAYQMMLRGE